MPEDSFMDAPGYIKDAPGDIKEFKFRCQWHAFKELGKWKCKGPLFTTQNELMGQAWFNFRL